MNPSQEEKVLEKGTVVGKFSYIDYDSISRLTLTTQQLVLFKLTMTEKIQTQQTMLG